MNTHKPLVLITGCVSLLGKYLVHNLSKNNFPLILASHNLPIPYQVKNKTANLKLDISDTKQVSEAINKYKPQIIIHLAALSNIDYCERNQKQAYQINVTGTKNIFNAAEQVNSKIIFISSNAIFDGYNPPYKETDQPHPLNYYGQTKALAEKIIITNKNNCVVRLTTIFGWPPKNTRDNDVTYYLKQIKTAKKIPLVTDRIFNPISAQTVAINIIKLVNINFSGIINLAGKDKINRFSFVKTIIKIFSPNNKIKLLPVTSDYFPCLAKRPIDACLDTRKAKSLINFDPSSLTFELIKMLKEITAKSNSI